MTKLNNNNLLARSPMSYKRQRGTALLITVAILVILTTIVFSLLSRLLIYKQRQQYMVSYQNARYACDSGMKYALTKAKEINPILISRDDVPDFSDLFFMDHLQQQEMLIELAEIKSLQMQEEEVESPEPNPNPLAGLLGALSSDPNEEAGLSALLAMQQNQAGEIDPNSLTIPGPYGAEWPYIQEPIKFEIGDSKVTINIRDENAKMPLTWGITQDKENIRAADDAIMTFCQWMQMDDDAILNLLEQLDQVKEYKPYSDNLKEIQTTEKVITNSKPTNTNSRRSRHSRNRSTTSKKVVTKKITRPAIGHTSDFARLLHSSLIDTDALAEPLPDTGDRYESALKYMALWGSQKVNINTAPRHVLEAVFTFGGDQEKVADAIIRQRRVEPFTDIEDFKRKNYGFSDSIRNVEHYIVTKSTFFAIEVTAVCGNAKITSVATVKVENENAETIGIMSN